MKTKPRVRRPGCERGGDALGGVGALGAVGGVQVRERDLERDRLGAVLDRRPAARRSAPRTAGPRRCGRSATSRRGSSPRARRAGRAGSGARCAGGGGRSRGRRPRAARRRASSSIAAHSSSKNSSFVSIGVAFSCTRWKSAPRAGSVVSVEKWRPAKEPARATSSWRSPSSFIASARPGAVELGDVAGVALGERVGALLRRGEHGVDGRGGIAGVADQQGIEVPGDLLDLGVCDVGDAHVRRRLSGQPACRRA